MTEPLQGEVLLGGGGPTSQGWHSGLADYLACAKRFQLARTRRISIPLVATPDHFAVGQLVHAGRARWFASKFATDDATWDLIRAAVADAAAENDLPVSKEAEQQALSILQQYVTHYSTRPRPKPVAAEYLLGPVPLDPQDPLYAHRTARLDDVSYYPMGGDKLYIGESKTTSTSVGDCVNQYTLHGQTMLQALLWKLAPQGEAMHGPIAGIMLDVIVKGYDKPCRFGRVAIPITDWQLDWFAASVRQALMEMEAVDWDTPVLRNPTSCTYLAGRARVECAFRDLCHHGKSAALKYVMGTSNGAQSLVRWTPSDKQTVPPWY